MKCTSWWLFTLSYFETIIDTQKYARIVQSIPSTLHLCALNCYFLKNDCIIQKQENGISMKCVYSSVISSHVDWCSHHHNQIYVIMRLKKHKRKIGSVENRKA